MSNNTAGEETPIGQEIDSYMEISPPGVLSSFPE